MSACRLDVLEQEARLCLERLAPKTYSSSSNVVSTTTLVPASAGSAVMAAVAPSPSARGIWTSIRTTSGSVSRA